MDKVYLEYLNTLAIENIIDGGVHYGEEIIKFIKYFPSLRRVYAFEPDINSFKNGPYFQVISNDKRVKMIQQALWNNKGKIDFEIISGRSRVVVNSKFLVKNIVKVETISIDDFCFSNNIKVDFIKLDVEGAEMNVVKGAINAINKFRPQMAISIYHNKNDLFEIIEFLNKNFENYLFKLAHYSPTIFETILYAIPEEKYEAT